jgi:hypothetical protein
MQEQADIVWRLTTNVSVETNHARHLATICETHLMLCASFFK